MNEKPDNSGIIRDENGKFVKGHSGNPEGRPKGSGLSLTTLVKRKLEETPEGQQISIAQGIVNRVIKQAVDGDMNAIKLVWSYIDGMPRQKMDLGLDEQIGKVEIEVIRKELTDEK